MHHFCVLLSSRVISIVCSPECEPDVTHFTSWHGSTGKSSVQHYAVGQHRAPKRGNCSMCRLYYHHHQHCVPTHQRWLITSHCSDWCNYQAMMLCSALLCHQKCSLVSVSLQTGEAADRQSKEASSSGTSSAAAPAGKVTVTYSYRYAIQHRLQLWACDTQVGLKDR